MFEVTFKQKLQGLLADKNFKNTFFQIVQNSSAIVEREYKREIPVDKGTARNSVYTQRRSDGYVVASLAQNRGFRYPIALQEGTGRWRGVQIDFPSKGRTRRGETSGRGTGGIPPNKFATRALASARPKVTNYIIQQLQKKL